MAWETTWSPDTIQFFARCLEKCLKDSFKTFDSVLNKQWCLCLDIFAKYADWIHNLMALIFVFTSMSDRAWEKGNAIPETIFSSAFYCWRHKDITWWSSTLTSQIVSLHKLQQSSNCVLRCEKKLPAKGLKESFFLCGGWWNISLIYCRQQWVFEIRILYGHALETSCHCWSFKV